jgi:cytochrome c biogenesis protein CcdA
MKRIMYFALMFLMLAGLASAANDSIDIYYFYGDGCNHCAEVADSGVLEKVELIDGVNLQKLNVRGDGTEKYNYFRDNLSIPAGWPLLIMDYNGEVSYLRGDSDIIDNLERGIAARGFSTGDEISWGDRLSGYLEEKFSSSLNPENGRLSFFGWGILIVSALVDSINPCAFGVLLFLMLSLLKMGSSKRALRAGLIYTFVVFVVYFLAGFGVFSAIQKFTNITSIIYTTAGVLVLILGLWQFKDVLLPEFGPSLAISPKVKPVIEKIIHKGTVPAMILLGIVVSIFELPCTGGVYLAVITVLAKFKVAPLLYLFVYNLIFVLPLVVLTLLVYRGASPTSLQRWTGRERKWMKLGAGIVLVALGAYILLF